jgi:Domain of unknown function (DUF1707)
MLDNMGRDDEMRAADADRQAVAERLTGALEEGRLDLHEYDERLQRAYAAKTYGELKGLLSDLPAAVQRQQPAQFAEVPTTGVTRRWLAETWDGYVRTVGVVIAIWAVTCIMSGELIYFWPGWVAGPWGVYLIYRTISGLATGEPRKWAAEEARKTAKKQAKKLAEQERKALEAEAIARGDEPLPKPAKKKTTS